MHHFVSLSAGLAFALALTPFSVATDGAVDPRQDRTHLNQPFETFIQYVSDPDDESDTEYVEITIGGAHARYQVPAIGHVFSFTTSEESAPAPASPQEDVTYHDGVYRSIGRGGKFGDVQVTLTIVDGAIDSIALGQNSESEAMAKKAQDVVVPQIIEKQSVEDIDLATGASCTSTAIIDGVTRALERAAQ